MISNPLNIKPIKFSLEGNIYQASPVVFSHLWGNAQRAAQAAGTTSTIALYDLYGKELNEHFSIPAPGVSQELVYLVIEEMTAAIGELKKMFVSSES